MIAASAGIIHLLLFLHIMAAIVAFGPSYAFPIIMGMARKDPQHMVFGAKVIHTLSSKMTKIGAILVGIFGILLIFAADLSLKDNPWLLIGLLIYVIALTFSVVVQGPNSEKMVALLSSATPGEAPGPEVAELGKRLQMGGTFLGLAVIVILLLMVFKPGA